VIAEGWLERLRWRGARRSPTGVIASNRLDALPLRTRLRRRVSPGLIAIVCGVLALLSGAWFLLRDSSLVAVRKVTVIGASGPDAARIRSALEASAKTMTTLDVRMGDLNMAVAPYPVVKSLQVSAQFPHGMRIRVVEQVPVAAVAAAGRSIAVAGDGTLLHDVRASRSLPTITMPIPPAGSRLTDPQALREVEVLAAAPYQLLARVGQASSSAAHGVVVQLRSGPALYFGTASRLGAKWLAVAAVLADSGSAGASYIDVTDPQRPAAGSGSGTGTPGTATASSGAGTGTPGTASGTGSAASATASGTGSAASATASGTGSATSATASGTSASGPTTGAPTTLTAATSGG
jgi:cell division protein FtsQ